MIPPSRRTLLAGLGAYPAALLAVGCASRAAAPAPGAAAAATPAAPSSAPAPRALDVYFGTYTSGTSASKGIYAARLDLASGALTDVALAAESRNPSYLAVHPNGRFLYAVNEEMKLDGAPTGGVEAFAIGPGRALARLNQVASGGGAPCHLTLDGAGKTVVVANYMGGNVASFPVRPDGGLGPRAGFVQHEGRGPNARRQEAPHAHAALMDPGGRRVFVADLGIDQLRIYGLDPAGALVANVPPSAPLPPGSGPRHLAFHPSGRFAYVNNELDATVTALAHDAGTGALTTLETRSTLPDGFAGPKSTAHALVTPDGRHLYVSNRGHDSLAVFAIDAASGRLAPRGHVPTGGRTPRDFGIDPSGAFLLAANQDSDTVVVFRIDGATGALAPVGAPVAVPRPVCVVFAPGAA
jgi:6-phosphogluconolactonase